MKKRIYIYVCVLNCLMGGLAWAQGTSTGSTSAPGAAATTSAISANEPPKGVGAESKPADPFAFADFSWAPASYAPTEASPFASKYFVPELRVDANYHYELANPVDDSVSGSSEVFRHNEFHLTQDPNILS